MSVDVSNIKISTVPQSKIDTVDFDDIPFGKVFTDHLFKATFRNGCWRDMEITPVENFSLHPSNQALHYGQSIFEGMKAAEDEHGVPLLFRPREHAHRLNRSARRMCMPEFPEDFFAGLHCVKNTLDSVKIPFDTGKVQLPAQAGAGQAFHFKARLGNQLFLHVAFGADEEDLGVGMTLSQNIGNCDGRVDMSAGTAAGKNHIHSISSILLALYFCREIPRTIPISPRFTARAVPP